MSGPIFSIPDIANALAKQNYNVEFISHPTSNYNPQLSRSVRIVKEPDLNSDVFIVDVSCDHIFVRAVKKLGKQVITTVHGKLKSGHQLNPDYVKVSVELASVVRFVSPTQQESFQLPADKYVVIPNMAEPVFKSQLTQNIGTVGNLSDPRKNAHLTVRLGKESNASSIYLWGAGNEFSSANDKVISKDWESNKKRIFDSFDVLVFLSSDENCPKVVLEALSCGIPCVLSDISAHKEFGRCEGVKLLNLDDLSQGVEAINYLLSEKEYLKDQIKEFWRANYSEFHFQNNWKKLIQTTLSR